ALYSPGVCFPHDKRGSVAEEQGVDGFQQPKSSGQFSTPLLLRNFTNRAPSRRNLLVCCTVPLSLIVLRQIPIKLTISLLIRARTASSCLLLCSIVFKYSASRTF